MSELKKNKLNIIFNAIGVTLNSFNSLFFLIIVKRVNGLDISGIFSYAFSLCCLFYFISIYYNRTFYVSDIDNKYDFNEYYSCRLITSFISLVLILLFSIISRFDIYKIAVISFIMLLRIMEAISECFYGVIHKNGDLYKVGISMSVKSLFGLILFLITDIITKNLLLSIASAIAINIIVLFVYDKKEFKQYNDKKVLFSFVNIKNILKETCSICLFSVVALYLINCQKYILTYKVTNDLQSIFGMIIMPGTVVSLLGNYILMPFINKITEIYNGRRIKELIKYTIVICLILLVFGVVAFVIAYFLGIPVLNIIFNINLDSYKGCFLVVLIGAILAAMCTTMSNILTVLRENNKQLVLYIFMSILTTFISICLINKNSIEGASFAYLITYILCFILFCVLFAWKVLKLKKSSEESV